MDSILILIFFSFDPSSKLRILSPRLVCSGINLLGFRFKLIFFLQRGIGRCVIEFAMMTFYCREAFG